MARNVLFEIGLEELPARYIDDAEKQLYEKTVKWLDASRITFEGVETYSTARRLAILIRGIADSQATIEEEAKGPAIHIAKDDDGNWTKAAIGFTKGQGKTVDDIYTKEVKGTEYIYVNKVIEGKSTSSLLPEFKDIILSIQFGKNMRWGSLSIRYARPIRWLVALYEQEIIPFEIGAVSTNNMSYGRRFLGKEMTITNPVEYKQQMEENYVIVDANEREKMIIDGINKIEEKENIVVPKDKDLLTEVRNLVEYPTAFLGSFEADFLELPEEVLVTSMKEHQRYFPVLSKEGKLLPHFIGVRNGDAHAIETVVKGNEKVLRARLSDAQFFYEEDQKNPIDYYLGKLKDVVFQEKLGTISDKVERVMKLSKHIAEALKLDKEAVEQVIRAAQLSKFDLTTNMVNEFPELQGIMGEKYARVYGENEAVAVAIREHYLPNSSGGNIPESTIGSVVSIADKLDTIVGCIGVGLKPTGSQDPYGLRRQAIGILRILEKEAWELSVADLFKMAIKLFHSLNLAHFETELVQEELHSFIQQRVAHLLKEEGIEQDIILAITTKEIGVMADMLKKASILSTKRNDVTFKPVQEALVRVLHLADKTDEEDINVATFETDSERNLYERFIEVKPSYQSYMDKGDLDGAFLQLEQLANPIHQFFENNMVMSDNEEIRRNRLALLNNIATLLNDFADLNAIEWKQHF